MIDGSDPNDHDSYNMGDFFLALILSVILAFIVTGVVMMTGMVTDEGENTAFTFLGSCWIIFFLITACKSGSSS
jgi:succinate dehydrogenase hydrophobic anchor subunit